MLKYGYPVYVYPDRPDEQVIGFKLIGPFGTETDLVRHVQNHIKDYTGRQAPAGVLVFEAKVLPLLTGAQVAA